MVALVSSSLGVATMGVVPVATPIELEVTVNRVVLTVGGEGLQKVLDVLPPATSLAVTTFSRLELPPSETDVAEEIEGRSHQAGAPVEVSGPLVMTARGVASSLRISPLEDPPTRDPEEAGPPAPWTPVEALRLDPGTRFELASAPGAASVELRVGISSAFDLSVPVSDGFVVAGREVDLSGPSYSSLDAASFELRGVPRAGELFARVFGSSKGLELIAELVGPEGAPGPQALSDGRVEIRELDLSRITNRGPVSSLVGGGRLTYAGRPDGAGLVLGPKDVVELGELSGFVLSGIDLTGPEGGLHLTLAGTAGHLRTGPPGQLSDRRLTALERWSPMAIFAAVAAWLVLWVPLLARSDRLWRRT